VLCGWPGKGVWRCLSRWLGVAGWVSVQLSWMHCAPGPTQSQAYLTPIQGYGFVLFETPESAAAAIKAIKDNGQLEAAYAKLANSLR
jgi:hypothetical protein